MSMCEVNDGNNEGMYVFRFGASKKIVQLTQTQLDSIPYLASLINHSSFFASIQNENGDYVLNGRIRYNCFMPIFHWITTGHPSVLFTELLEEAYVCSMLQLYDYLCLNPMAVPVLKSIHLVRLNQKEIVAKNFRIEYMRAKTLLEVRDTAVQFVIALSKNEYDLHDFDTRSNIFSLVMIILSNRNVFSSRLLYHTLMLTKKFCFSLFSYSQQHQLQQMEQSMQSSKPPSFDDTSDDEKPVPHDFQNVFIWKDVYVSIEENQNTHRRSTWSEDLIDTEFLRSYLSNETDWFILYESMTRFSIPRLLINWSQQFDLRNHRYLEVKFYRRV